MAYKCPYCPGHYSSSGGLTRHINHTCGGYRLRLADTENKKVYIDNRIFNTYTDHQTFTDNRVFNDNRSVNVLLVNNAVDKTKLRLKEVETHILEFLNEDIMKRYLKGASANQLRELPQIIYNTCLQRKPEYKHLNLLKYITLGESEVIPPKEFSNEDLNTFQDKLFDETEALSKNIASTLRSNLKIEEIPDDIILGGSTSSVLPFKSN